MECIIVSLEKPLLYRKQHNIINIMKTRDIDNLIDFFESKKFGAHYDKESDSIDFETWTKYGVNMFIHFDKLKRKSMDDIEVDFNEYVESFDVDEEIDLHREGENYKNAFSYRQAVEDFEAYETRLEETLAQFQERNKIHERLGIKMLKANILNGRFKPLSKRWYYDIFIKNVEELVWSRNMVDGYNVDFRIGNDSYRLHFDGNLKQFEIDN